MIILGVDPGTTVTGYGLITFSNNCHSSIASGTVSLPGSLPLEAKLSMIYDSLNNLIKLYKPDQFAIETAFFGKNVQSALKIGYARGVSMLAAVHNSVPSFEYSPREIKRSVVGNGAASKEQVQFMISTLLSIDTACLKLDETDALAVALCHAFRFRSPVKKSNNWKDFIESHPDRVIE